MEEWSSAAEFEAVARKAVESRTVTTVQGVTSVDARTGSIPGSIYSSPPLLGMDVRVSPSVPSGTVYTDSTSNRLIVSSETASQFRYVTDPSRSEKQEKPMSERNSKTFEVVYTDDKTELIPAQSATESEGRLTFNGFVEGVDDSYGNTVIKSVKADDVKSYRVVPKPEVDAKAKAKNTYRVNLVAGGSKDVKADHVLFQAGSGEKPGRYSLVTAVPRSDNRTEFIIAEDKVESVERVEADGSLTNLTSDVADA